MGFIIIGFYYLRGTDLLPFDYIVGEGSGDAGSLWLIVKETAKLTVLLRDTAELLFERDKDIDDLRVEMDTTPLDNDRLRLFE